ncbi:MAG: hypothetical protein LBU21_03715 [Treponema sp.]|jgi:hypothetical protein|nr:hypothetical protein [Treponema sp.]
MKKIRLCAVLLLMAAAALGAQSDSPDGEAPNSWQMPDRIVELGLDLDLGFGNTIVKLGDIFNFRKTLRINLASMAAGKLSAMENAALSAFFDVHIGNKLSIGVFSGFQVDAFQSAPKEFTELLRRGNAKTKSVKLELSAGAAAFVDAGLRVESVVDKLRVAVKPAAYVPLVYLPPLDMGVELSMTESGMVLDGSAVMNMYAAVSPEKLLEEGITDLAVLIPSPLPLGFDLSLEGSYELLPVLDLGLSISHIPLYPAQLRYRMRQEFSIKGDWSDLFNTLTEGNFDMPAMESSRTYSDGTLFTAFRPLRFDVSVAYRPLGIDLFVFRSHIGFSVLTVFGYDTACFNAGLGGEIRIANILGLSLGTDYVERLWKHALGLRLNLRALELNGEISLKGPDIPNSFQGRGLGATVGIRLGF